MPDANIILKLRQILSGYQSLDTNPLPLDSRDLQTYPGETVARAPNNDSTLDPGGEEYFPMYVITGNAGLFPNSLCIVA